MADKNALLARIFDARMLRQAAGNVARHRITDLRDPWTGDIPRHARVRLDCLDGQHDACETCGCPCHEEPRFRAIPMQSVETVALIESHADHGLPEVTE